MAEKKSMALSTRKTIATIMKYMIGVLIVICVMGPILITIFASIKTKGGMVNSSPLVFPSTEIFTLDNYQDVLSKKTLFSGFKNTFLIVIVSIIFNIMFGSITAYCLERFNFRFKKVVFAMFFLGMLVPTYVTEIARFKLIEGMGLYNTLYAPILIYVASDLMQLYIYRQFISRIPVSLDESALIDGCGYFRIFGQIIFPLLAPATATLVIIKSVNIINDMYIPYLYMPKNSLKTLTTFLMNFASSQGGSWQKLSAAIVIVMIPTVVIYIFFQKYIFEGISAGAVKE